LDHVDGIDHGGFGGRFSWLGNSLLATMQADWPLFVAKFHLAFQHRQNGPAVLSRLEIKFGAANGRGCGSRLDVDIRRFAPMKKVQQAARKAEPRLFSGGDRRLNREVAEFPESRDTSVR